MAHHIDGSGRYAEVISPPTSPPTEHMTRQSSAMSTTMENVSPNPAHHNDKKDMYSSGSYFPGLEAVEPYPPQYGHYGGPPPGSPPPPAGLGQPCHDKEEQPGIEAVPQRAKGPMVCGMKKRTFILLLAILAVVVLAIALGVGLGVGRKDKDSNDSDPVEIHPVCRQHPELCVGGALNAEYYSTKGAFNGSGFALAGESWNKDQRRIFTLYFQHHTGDIRYMQYRTDRQWEGGDKSYTVATDAKNGTAISAVSYALNGTQYFHLFYVAKNNTIKQITQSNSTDDAGNWRSGSLTNLQLEAFDSPTIGLQACWKGDYYGGSDPVSEGDLRKEDLRGINIWFPSDESTFEQYSWNNGQDEWVRESPWTGKNAYAGVGCYSWSSTSIAYTMMVNEKNATEFWWKDTNSSLTSTEKHPINSWKNATGGSIQGVHPLSSLGFTNYLYMQMEDRTLRGFDVDWSAENTTLKTEPFTIRNLGGPVPGLAGTHMSVTAYTEFKDAEPGKPAVPDAEREKEWDSLYVFYQIEGDDIAAFSRPISGGEWTKGALKVPTE